MKTQTMLLVGGAAVVGYILYRRATAAPKPVSTGEQIGGKIGAAIDPIARLMASVI